MMTFKDFLAEDIVPNMPLAQYVKMRCAPYLKLPGATSGLLFRGLGPFGTSSKEKINGTDVKWKVVTARKNRPAGDTPQEFSDEADKYFQETFGWKARGDATFVSGNMFQAGNYGDVHIVIPMGETKFVWSPKLVDLYTEVFIRLFGRYGPKSNKDPEEHAKFIEAIKKANYTDADLAKAISSRHEIALNCQRYVAIDISKVPAHGRWDIAGAIGIKNQT
jgi:hypothetical protein